MNFITAEDASIKWGLGLRTVQRMCASGKIEGVKKISNIWMIPDTANLSCKQKKKSSVTVEQILDAYNAFVLEDHKKYNDFFDKNNVCKSRIAKAYYYAVKSYKYFPQIEKMAEDWSKAKECLEGTNCKIPEISLTVGGHYTLGVFLQRSGDADKISSLISEYLPLFECITGHKSGLDLLFRAELCLRRGDIAQAELLCYKATFGYDSNVDVKLGISYILAHISICKRDVDGWKRAIEMINQISNESKISKSSIEIAKSELLLVCGFIERIPDWLKQGDFKEKKLTITSKYNALFVHLSYLTYKKEYAKAIAFSDYLLENVHEHFYVSCYSYIYLYLIMAICYNKLYMNEKCLEYYKKALELAKPDKLLMPFVEYYDLLGKVCEKYLLNKEYDIYKKVYAIKKKYSENLISLKSALKEPELTEGLTDREKEISLLIGQGMSNAEIAAQLYISKSTVNYHIQNIYNKLGVNRRSMMIKLLFFDDKND